MERAPPGACNASLAGKCRILFLVFLLPTLYPDHVDLLLQQRRRALRPPTSHDDSLVISFLFLTTMAASTTTNESQRLVGAFHFILQSRWLHREPATPEALLEVPHVITTDGKFFSSSLNL